MTPDQKIVYDWVFKPNVSDGTHNPKDRAELQEKVDAVNRVVGCNLVVRALNDNEIGDKRLPEAERPLIIAEA